MITWIGLAAGSRDPKTSPASTARDGLLPTNIWSYTILSARSRYFPGGKLGRESGSPYRSDLATAVDRNRVKRVLREAFRANDQSLKGNMDFVLIARAPTRGTARGRRVEGRGGEDAGDLPQGSLVSSTTAAAATLLMRSIASSRSSRNPMKALFIGAIRLYQLVISPGLPGRCKFYPSCSQYAIDAISEYGAARGSVLAPGGSCAAIRSATEAMTRYPARNCSRRTFTRLAPRRRRKCRTAAQRGWVADVSSILSPAQRLLLLHPRVHPRLGDQLVLVDRGAHHHRADHPRPAHLAADQEHARHAGSAPEIKALQEKYKDNKQLLNQKTMEFYQENKVSPFGSCLPLLLQMPVFFGLYYMLRTQGQPGGAFAFPNPTVPWLWIQDITKFDIILMFLYIASQFVASWQTSRKAAGQQKMIAYMMPIIVGVFMFIGKWPAGLFIYWFTSNLWTIAQQYVAERMMPMPVPVAASSAKDKIAGQGSREDGT